VGTALRATLEEFCVGSEKKMLLFYYYYYYYYYYYLDFHAVGDAVPLQAWSGS